MPQFKFLYKRQDILKYVDTIQKEADKEKKALGFLAQQAYQSAAYSEKIIVAVVKSSSEYAGHIFYGGVFPNARVFQTLVSSKYRKHGLAIALIEKLTSHLEEHSFVSITAKVATDLAVANRLYESQGFEIVRTFKGGKTTGRTIHLRGKKLNTPSLFSWMAPPNIASDFSLPLKALRHSPQYLIDLNVIFDAVRKRANTRVANVLFKASFQNLIRIAVSDELIEELERNTSGRDTDPVLEMVKNFWTLANPSAHKIKEISDVLAPIIFPDRYKSGKLTVQDKSDLVHLATAVENNVAGFVTSEKKILAAGDFLRSEYQIDVISLYDLEELVKDVPENTPVTTFTTSDFQTYVPKIFTESPEVQSAITSLNIPTHALPGRDLNRNSTIRSIIISTHNNKDVALAWWTTLTGPAPINSAYIYIDETVGKIENLVDYICSRISREVSLHNVSLVRLVVDAQNPVTQSSFERNGYKPTGTTELAGNVYQKICLGNILHQENWQQMRLNISQLTDGLLLSKTMPSISSENKLIDITGNKGNPFSLDFNDFEQLLSPTLVMSSQISGVIVPIVRSYADDLFGMESQQLSLLQTPDAVLRQERVYFCKQAAQRTLKPGRIIMFYESGSQKFGRSAVIAAGRITQTNVVSVEDMEDNLLQRGVIDQRMLAKSSQSGKRTVVFFNRILLFNSMVSFNRLNELGCDNGSHFVTATKISAAQTEQILIEGLHNA